MDGMTRRAFVGKGGRAAAAVLAGTSFAASPLEAVEGAWASGTDRATRGGKQAAILYDSTLCIGCRACELACNDENELGRSPEEIFVKGEEQDFRALRSQVFTRVTQHDDLPGGAWVAFGKAQCMHCLDPACASSCPVSALEKTAEGPVIWHEELCLGCRYCMMACPFMVPRFEWGSRVPRIRKCQMCHSRIEEGQSPACVAICPTGALRFGTREELLDEAHRRILEMPRGYIHHVYGETEAGGTNVLHLAAHPFSDLGYPGNVPNESSAERTRPAMAAIPIVLNGLIVLLGASAWALNRRDEGIRRKEEVNR